MAVDVKFLQRIDINCPTSNLNVTLRFNSMDSKWHSIARKINVDPKDISVGLSSTLMNASNLASIMTMEAYFGHDFDDFNTLRNIDTLKHLRIIGTFRSANDYSFLQSLINSAANLVVLDVQGNFFPSLLTSCRNLKVMKWIGYHSFYRNGNRPFNQNELFRILNEVGEGLEELSVKLLDISRNYKEYSQPNDEAFNSFPNMPKLEKITVCPFDFLRPLERICPLKHPNLKEISFQNGEWIHLSSSTFDVGNIMIHEGVTSLELIGVHEADQILLVSKRYPNVNRLVLSIVSDFRNDEGGFIGRILQACSKWNLLYLEVKIRLKLKLSQLLKGLRYLGVVKGLKEVKIIVGFYRHVEDDIMHHDFEAFKQVFQLGGKMDKMTFIGFGLKLHTAKKVFLYLEQCKELPVYCLD